jgi:polyferredoxin
VDAIRAFLDGPYGLIADVKLLNFFRYLSIGGAFTLALLVILSVFVQNFWCRYLCPYGALLGLFSLASPLRIRRSTTLCIDCGKCSRECPSLLPVDRLVTIRSAECTGCMQCLAACPVASALVMLAPGIRMVPAWAIGAVIAVVFFGLYGLAVWTGHWHTELPYACIWSWCHEPRNSGTRSRWGPHVSRASTLSLRSTADKHSADLQPGSFP